MPSPLIFRDLLGSLSSHARLLVAVATPLEAAAIIPPSRIGQTERPWTTVAVADRVDLLITGVGKAPAAAAVAALLARGAHGGVLNLGIAGALPTDPILPLLSVVLASEHAFGDEGVATGADSEGFQSLSAMGFAPPGTVSDAVPADPEFTAVLRALLPEAAFAPIATVSTCSGTDARAIAIASRTRARAECMEGAAVALAALHLGCRYAEVRTISNTTGDRSRQVWDVRGAVARLSGLLAAT